jgi:CubicO group peptidase (beta-lactamase class C family)
VPAPSRSHRLVFTRSAAAACLIALAACGGSTTGSGQAIPAEASASATQPASPGVEGPEQEQIAAVAKDAMAKYGLKALIVRVTTDGKDTYTAAMGESMTGVPATPAMKVRNGFVAYMYETTMLMEFVDQGKISLDDKLSKYLPNLPRANDITIKMLANSTTGYADFVYQSALSNGIYTNPFRKWTGDELIQIGISAPADFAPGTNWAYSHTNYLILGSVLAKVGGKPMDQLMQQYIFEPMGLAHTTSSDTPDISPGPVLHTYSSERRVDLGIAPKTPFYEDTTFWDPSWTVPEGASQASDIADLTTSVAAIGSGKLLSPASYDIQMSKSLVGFGHKQAGCSACAMLTASHTFGMATILQGPWITGNKFYAGSGAEVAYLPSAKIAIAVITTYLPSAFDSQGNVTDAGPTIAASISQAVAPDEPIPG